MTVLRVLAIGLATAILGTGALLAMPFSRKGGVFSACARAWSRFVLRLCGVNFTVARNAAYDPGRPAVYIANHQSLLDVPALALAMPGRFRFVAKHALFYIPVFGWVLWLAGFVFVDRGNRERAIRSLRRGAARLRDGSSLIVFAEGTRTPDGRLQPFKKGGFVLALEAGLPIVPVSLRGGRAILPKERLQLSKGTIAIAFGGPIDTRRYSYATRDDLIEETRRRIAAGLEEEPVRPAPGPALSPDRLPPGLPLH